VNLIGFIRDRARHYRCISCSQLLGTGCEVNVLSQNEGHCSAEITCGRCGFSFVAVFVIARRRHPDGVPRGAREPISADELLELHERLRDFDGSLAELGHQPSQRT